MMVKIKKWFVKVEAKGIAYGEDEEEAMEAFIEGCLDFYDFEFKYLGEELERP